MGPRAQAIPTANKEPEVRSFDTFDAAYSYCREKDQPVEVEVAGKRHKLFPSGKGYEVVQSEQREFHPPDICTKFALASPIAPTPSSILQDAVQRGANVDTLARLLELQERWEANEARKAFVKALTAFKANPPKIEKTKRVTFKDVDYMYAPLDEVTEILGPALSKHALSFRWATSQIDGLISVTCILQHEQGHSESVTLSGPADTTGAKNAIQAISSTVTLLERYTLRAITGTAEADQDTDGNVTMNEAADFVTLIQESQTPEELAKNFKEATADGLRKQSPKAVTLYMEARKKREKELRQP